VLTVGSNPFRDHLGEWMDVVAAGQEVIVTRHGKPRLRLLPATPSASVQPMIACPAEAITASSRITQNATHQAR